MSADVCTADDPERMRAIERAQAEALAGVVACLMEKRTARLSKLEEE
ncbi:MAG: hypothetical protein ACK2UK_18285 [Candidatus Promineifilaceae bacterium]